MLLLPLPPLPPLADRLAIAEAHLIECEERITRQQQVVERLTARGSPRLADATRLLLTFETTCALAREHRNRLQEEADRSVGKT